jgi:hypothetical protein
MAHDIIGDIHGHADQLEALLGKLGYAVSNGAWRHAARTAIFVGDLIDRGPGQLRTLRLVRAMVEAGSAQVVMGNHELNAIGWATNDPDAPNLYLRPRHGAKGQKNLRQHQAFLTEVGPESGEHRRWIDWFKSLPLWIETDAFRVVHACWDPASAEIVRPQLNPDGSLTETGFLAAYRPGDPIRAAVDVLLKGPEVQLPQGAAFTDKDGHVRHEIRTRWWAPRLSTYCEAYIGPDGVDIPDIPLPATSQIPEPDRPTFIGHYWLNPSEPPRPLAPLVACVDYSVAKGGPLAAYRYDGEAELDASSFVVA